MEPEEAMSPKSEVSDVDVGALMEPEPSELFGNNFEEISMDALGNQTEKNEKDKRDERKQKKEKDKKDKKDKKRKRSSMSSDDEKPLSSSIGSRAAKAKAASSQKELAVAKSPQDFLSELMETHKVICELCGTESTAQDA